MLSAPASLEKQILSRLAEVFVDCLSLGGAELEHGKKGRNKEISCLAPLHARNCICIYIYVYIGAYTCTYLHVYKYKLFEHFLCQ